MRKNNKDYKPLDQYIDDREAKRLVARGIAAQVRAITAQQHVDIGMLINALQCDLLATWEAAKNLGLSSHAFLRLRRKYGLEPIYKVAVWGEPKKVKYLYAPEQLTRIPPLEVELSKRRSAMAATPRAKKGSVIDAGIDLEWVFRRAG